jgi:hypothetical protein
MTRAWLCFCGNAIAPVLAGLGSLRCHDCRDDPQRARQHENRAAAAHTLDPIGIQKVKAA